MSPHISRTFGGFRHRVELRLTVLKPWSIMDETWVYPPLVGGIV